VQATSTCPRSCRNSKIRCSRKNRRFWLKEHEPLEVVLSEMLQQVTANPFKKVKKLTKDLIVQLMEEATAEVEHKGWCDTELTTNKQTCDAKTADVASLTSEPSRFSNANQRTGGCHGKGNRGQNCFKSNK